MQRQELSHMAICSNIPAERTSARAVIAPKYFDALDGFRMFSVCLIVLFHCPGLLGYQNTGLMQFAGHAVCYFFILSGFVLTHHYQFDNVRQFLRYIGARFARIWPCYAASVILCFFLRQEMHANNSFFNQVFWSNVFLLQSWYPDSRYYFAFVAPAWTLSVEFFLYLLLPVLLILSKRKWLFLTASFAFSLACHAIAYHLHPDQVAWWLSVLPLLRVFDFSLGIVIYRRMKELNFQLSPLTASIFDLAFVVFLVMWSLKVPDSFAASMHMTKFGAMVFSQHFVPAVTFVPLVISLAGGNGILSRLFAFKPLVAFSAISCSLYLVHGPVILFWQRIAYGINESHPFLLCCILVFVLACAVMMYVCVEDPARKLINYKVNTILGFPTKTALKLAPTRRVVMLSLISLATAGVLYTSLRSTLAAQGQPKWLSQAEAQSSFANSMSEPAEVTFENFVTLVSIKSISTPDKLVLKTLWRSTSRTNICQLAVHLIDGHDQIAKQYDHNLVSSAEKADLLWSDTTEIDKAALSGIKTIGLAIVVDGKTLRADRGKSDWGAHRLLIDVPR
jgi:peptidoglycan/LPS O-acetylase OafA/YrhL